MITVCAVAGLLINAITAFFCWLCIYNKGDLPGVWGHVAGYMAGTSTIYMLSGEVLIGSFYWLPTLTILISKLVLDTKRENRTQNM